MKTKLQRMSRLLLVLVAAFSIFTSGLLLNARPSSAIDFSALAINAAKAIAADTLQLGSTGTKVQDLQNLLNTNGANPHVTVDGTFGPTTKDAVISYQKKHGLTADGIVGQRTLLSLKF
jgi:peptidoglycan hydrolase-like protein with peptidoglycan-binding domain